MRPTRSSEPLYSFWRFPTESKSENRPILCFHLLFHRSFHPGGIAKYSEIRQIVSSSAGFGDGRGDGERAVATPLFVGERRPRALRVSRDFALLQDRHRPLPKPGMQCSRFTGRNTTTDEINYAKSSAYSSNPAPSQGQASNLQFPNRHRDRESTVGLRGIRFLRPKPCDPRGAQTSLSK